MIGTQKNQAFKKNVLKNPPEVESLTINVKIIDIMIPKMMSFQEPSNFLFSLE
jgi:hypothetical protein